MNRIVRLLVVLLFGLLACRALGGVEGTYELDLEALKVAIRATLDFQQIPESQRGMALSMFVGMKVTMTLKDGLVTGHSEGMCEVEEGKGIYSVEGDVLTVTLNESNGVALAEPEVNKAKIEGDKIVIREEGMPFAIYLVKAQ